MGRRGLAATALAALALALLARPAPEPLGAPPLGPAPPAAGRATDRGVPVAGLSALLPPDRVAVLNFWATWCAPCREELPQLARLAAALPGVAVLAVHEEGAAPEAALRFAARHAPGLEVAHDRGGAWARALGVAVTPTTVVLDRQGRVAARVAGAWDWSAPEVRAWLRSLARRDAAPVTTQ